MQPVVVMFAAVHRGAEMKALGLALVALLSLAGFSRAEEMHDADQWSGPKYEQLKAKWPRDSSGGLIYGKALLDCAVGPQGFAADCKVLSSQPSNPALEKAALDLSSLFKAREWMFETRDGEVRRAALEVGVQYDEMASQLRKPNFDQLMANYPAAAQSQGASGFAVIRCTVQTDGFLRSCTVIREDPSGLGFGPAAVVLSHVFLMKPAMRDGKAVESEMNFTTHFLGPGRRYAGSIIHSTTVLGGATWAKTPTVPEILAEIDKKVGDKFADGQVVFQCNLAKSTGKMSNCIVANTSPGMAQFTGVAKSLVPKFQADPKALTDIKGDVRINIAFGFPDMSSPAWSERYLTHPQWTQKLSADPNQPLFPAEAAKAGLKTGSATVDCVVAADGKLTQCKTLSESTPGVGFGAIAEKIASAFAVNPWTDDGLPADGAHVKMPIRMVYNEGTGAPTPATTPEASPGSPPPSR